jgi:hypothetical protein
MSRGRSRTTSGPTAVALLAALMLAGCSGTAGFEGPDPLTGGPPIQRRTSPAPTLAAGLSSSPSSGITPTAAGQLPPVPTPSTATSQAALAGGVSQPLDTGRDLRIGGTPTAFAQEQPLWHGADPSTQTPGAHLTDPQMAGGSPPASVPVQTIPSAPTIVPASGGGAASTLDQALKQLNEGRKVTWQRLETLDKGGWWFQCSIANPAKPDTEVHYEAKGATELEVVRSVLVQIGLEKR